MLTVEPSGEILCATVRGVDLSKPLSLADKGKILEAIGKHGLLRFPDQHLSVLQHKAFCEQFGEMHHSSQHFADGVREISVLSNIKKDGQPIGYPDAGIIWHRDMTYTPQPGFANVLYALIIPKRDGKPLGNTEFINSQAAYRDLPEDVKKKIAKARGLHSVEKYNETVRALGSKRPAYKDQVRQSPKQSHPLVFNHPITGSPVLYCDPSHVAEIEGLPEGEDGDAMLDYLIQHQLQDKYRYVYRWTQGDAVMWDNLGSLHRVIIDFTENEPRLMHRAQIMADRINDPAFLRPALEAARQA
jgi:taurine dioxygenase